jgi:hypothetical protein
MSRQFTRDFFFEIAKGNVAGHSAVIKFGENPDIDSGSGFEDIWDAGGTYAPPTQARIHDVASDNAADTGTTKSSGTATGGSLTSLVDSGATFLTDLVAVGDLVLNDTNVEVGVVSAIPSETEITIVARMRSPNTGADGNPNESGDSYRVVGNASTGASTFHVVGLDGNFAQLSEFSVLNGVSNVPTVNSYLRQFRARVFGAFTGTRYGGVGTISSTAQTDATVSCQVVNGNNQTLMAIYTVPAGKTGYIARWWARIARKISASSRINLRVGQLDGIGYLIGNGALNTQGSSLLDDLPFVQQPVPGGADIYIEADSDTNDLGVSAGFDIILVDD